MRPVEEVLEEWIADCASLIRQSEEEVYGDARPSTPAMQRAAAAADEHERHPYPDEEAAADEYAALGAGYVEITLAAEGC